MISKAQLLPTVMIILDLGASVVCGFDGDVRRSIYWFAAAVLTAAVTF